MNNADRDRHEPDELTAAITAVADEPRLTRALRSAEHLRLVAALSTDQASAARRLSVVVRDGDALSALAAIHALGSVRDELADDVLLRLTVQAEEPFAAHAAWALAARRSSPEAVDALIELVAAGGFTAMLAERTLIEWSRCEDGPELVAARSVAASTADGDSDGIVVIQPFLHARLDAAGSTLGAGDAGGIASLLRSLGAALAQVDGIDEVITVTRRNNDTPRAAGEPQARDARTEMLAPGHRVERIDVGPAGPLPWREAWAHRVEIERQFMAIGRALAGRRVVWHLRMADVGTLAASAVARRLGQPVVFTAAPDPHIVIDALQDSNRLDRPRFAVEEAAAQFWFRARMVERLTALADRLALLPRPTIERELVDLVGLEPSHLAERATIVPEGVDVIGVDGALARFAEAGTADLISAILATLPEDRRRLPWLLTVGRLHPSKGPHRIVEAVTSDPTLLSSVNLVIVGGDLDHPSPDEQSTIELIRRAAVDAPSGAVTLTGHLPPTAIYDLMVFVADQPGAYVCASDKEEFGLSIVEAMAAGAMVVAPQRGGPRSYIADEQTGILCDTLSVSDLGRAIHRALDLAADEQRRERSMAMVRADLSIAMMAERLGAIYSGLLPSAVLA